MNPVLLLRLLGFDILLFNVCFRELSVRTSANAIVTIHVSLFTSSAAFVKTLT